MNEPQSKREDQVRRDVGTLATSTLDDLDLPAWGSAPEGASRLVARVHELRQVPLATFEVEDLRLLVGQGVALHVVVPLALAVLRASPLAEGDFYPGDLLLGVLGVPASYWRDHPSQVAVLREVAAALDPADPDYPAFVPDDLGAAAAAFLAIYDGDGAPTP